MCANEQLQTQRYDHGVRSPRPTSPLLTSRRSPLSQQRYTYNTQYTSLSVWPTCVDYLKCLDLPPLPRKPNPLLLDTTTVSPKPLL